MRKLSFFLSLVAVLTVTQSVLATVTIAHVENAGAQGQFLDSLGASLPAGGVSIGFFSSAPSDSAFGTTIVNWAGVVAAGYTDLRSIAGTTQSGGFDWNFPLPIGGSVLGIPIASLPANTQLYIFAFDAGTYNTGTPLASFVGATQWAVVKDNNNLSPADSGIKPTTLDTVTASEVLQGTDNGVNVNLTVVPEPSAVGLVGVGIAGLLAFRRRKARLG